MNRVPPHDAEVERDVLATAVLLPDSFATARDTLAADGSDFYLDRHAKIWRAAMAAHRAGDAVDSVSVSSRLRTDDERETLLEVTGRLGSAAALEGRCARLRDLAAMRAVIARAHELCASGYDAGAEDPRAWLDEAEGALQAAAKGRTEDGAFVPMQDAVAASVNAMVAHAEAGGGIQGTASGLGDLDAVLSGWCPGRLIVLAGRPGSGKSAIAKQIAIGVTRSAGAPGLFASLEMPLAELGDRAVVSEARVPYGRYRSAQLGKAEMTQAMRGANEVAGIPLWVCDRPGIGVDFLARNARRIRRQHRDRMAIVVVDYLQLMGGHFPRGTSREERVSENTRALKCLAKELEVPVLVLSQLNRAVESRSDKRPTMADLRESGAIEQDADAVILIYRAGAYNSQAGNVVELNVAKHRAGETGVVKMVWRGEHQRVEALERHRGAQHWEETDDD